MSRNELIDHVKMTFQSVEFSSSVCVRKGNKSQLNDTTLVSLGANFFFNTISETYFQERHQVRLWRRLQFQLQFLSERFWTDSGVLKAKQESLSRRNTGKLKKNATLVCRFSAKKVDCSGCFCLFLCPRMSLSESEAQQMA